MRTTKKQLEAQLELTRKQALLLADRANWAAQTLNNLNIRAKDSYVALEATMLLEAVKGVENV